MKQIQKIYRTLFLFFMAFSSSLFPAAVGGLLNGLGRVVEGAANVAGKTLEVTAKAVVSTVQAVNERLEENHRRAQADLGAAQAEFDHFNTIVQRHQAAGGQLTEYDKRELGRLSGNLIACRARVERAQEALTAAQKSVTDSLQGAVAAGSEFMKSQATLPAEQARIRENGQQSRLWLGTLMDRLKEPEFTNRALLLIGGGTTLAAGGYYTTKLAASYYESKLGKPTLVQKTSRKTFFQLAQESVMSFIQDTQEPQISMNDIVISPDQEAYLSELVGEVTQANKLGLEYSNILFYGPPGTGKTAFAERLAKTSGLDFAIMSGADFSQFKRGEGITELHNVLNWAENNSKGTLIFIDEADACFRDRQQLSTQEREVVNALLSRTGAPSKKFLLVFATNFKDELDAALMSRISHKVPFNLPSVHDRYKILHKKFETYIYDDQRVVTHGDDEVVYKLQLAPNVDDQLLRDLASKTAGFSGRALEQLVLDIRGRGYRAKDCMITRDLVMSAYEIKRSMVDDDNKSLELQRKNRMQS